MTYRRVLALCGVACALAACHDNAPSGPSTSTTLCTGGDSVLALGALQGITVAGSGGSGCVTLPADGGTYIVVPQFPTQTAPVVPVSFELGTQSASAAAALSPDIMRSEPRASVGLQQQLDHALRSAEHRLAPEAARSARERAAQRATTRQVAAAAVPAIGSTANFQVLTNLNGTSFTTDTAVLRYVGAHIMIYVDQNAPAPPDGSTDAQLAAFGDQFDRELYDVDVTTFGAPSDIDNNGHVIVLMTNLVNALTPASTCSTAGFVAGFFFGLDLIPSQPHSNKAEIFYSLVPDPRGRFSCAHSVADVGRLSPATFIHEFQHMISFNQHVLVRGGPDEVDWLNEGLSHIAEELGSRYYEHKYPPPLDRTSDPTSLFPDSSLAFISGDLFNSYGYLSNTTALNDTASVTNWPGNGTLEERGGAWLFLRWLGDQQDSTIYGRLDQTSLTGVANIEAASGAQFTQLFGNFSLAVYTDSLVGVSRDAIPQALRFTSRNLRQLYSWLFSHTTDRTRVPRPFPITLSSVPGAGSAASSMFPGTMDHFLLQVPPSGAPQPLQFSQPNGTAFDADLNAQLSIFRCPSAQACQ